MIDSVHYVEQGLALKAIVVVLQLDDRVPLHDAAVPLDTPLVCLVCDEDLAADGARELHDDPLLEAGGVEDVLRVAAQLHHGVARDVLVFAAQVEVGQADRALLAVLCQVEVVLDDLLLDLQPELAAEGQEPLAVVVLGVILLVVSRWEVPAVNLNLVAHSQRTTRAVKLVRRGAELVIGLHIVGIMLSGHLI